MLVIGASAEPVECEGKDKCGSFPIIHPPQLIGLALGIPPKELRMDRRVVGTRKVLDKVLAQVGA